MNKNMKETEQKSKKTEGQNIPYKTLNGNTGYPEGMDYETFITEMAHRIQQHADTGTRIHLEDMTANNGISRKGITVQEKGRNTAPEVP